MHRIFIKLVIAALLFNAWSATAQDLLNIRGDKVIPYYLTFEEMPPTNVSDVRGEFLHFSYNDRISSSNYVMLSVINSKREVIKTLKLAKEFGLNYFDIKLADFGITLTENESYSCVLTNEKNQEAEILIRYLPKIKSDLTAGILVNPINLACFGEGGNNLMEFLGDISGGRAPYKTSWFVMNATRTEFLNQPIHASVQKVGSTSAIQVDQNPEYFVLLYVTDACGNEQMATVKVVCERKKKKVNTVFFQQLEDAVKGVKSVEPVGK